MKGNIYARCLLIIILWHLGFATEDSYIQDVQRIEGNSLVNKNRNKNYERSLYEKYYRDLKPENYDQDYPYRPYMEESNDEESGKDSIRTSGKKRIMKRRGSKDKNLIEKDTSSKNNHIKSRIKSQKRSKTHLRTKLRRSADSEGQLVNKENERDNNGGEEPYLAGIDSMKTIIDSADTSDSGRETLDLVKNYTNLLAPKELNYQPSYALNSDYDNLQKSEDKISALDYLRLLNSSDIDMNELNDYNDNEEDKRIVVLSPDDFKLASLTKALGESINTKNIDFPKCPAKNNEIKNNEESDEEIRSDDRKEFLKQRDEIKSVYNELLGQNYLKQDLQDSERNYGSNVKSIGDLRTKREQKLKTITLTFPIVENLESLITVAKKGNVSNNQKITDDKDMKNGSKLLSVNKGSRSTVSAPDHNADITTQLCSHTTDTCFATTRMNNFKELNEGCHIIKNLPDYIANILKQSTLVDNNNNKSSVNKDRIIMSDSGAIIPITLKKIIKLKANNEKKRSNENDNSSQDIYIVEFAKDQQVNDTVLPIQSPQMIFSIPDVPRSKR
ncbi:hypothetical protein O3M35_007002 [Rhynocoris fuscipes]|uniref:Uncharacterized protein n=1 Tax=Rhynocoris fuscipes TaxID=488301 RepID=A0AAW1DKT1_9HEMI